MGYYGKLSRGCLMCRSRRVKCDEQKPWCTQCKNARIRCPGYRSDAIASAATPARHSGRRSLAQRAPVSPPPQLPTAELAAHHFIANYVLVPRYAATRGYLEFVLPLMRSDVSAPQFRLAFDACALASLYGYLRTDSNRLGTLMLQTYTKALACTCSALQNPELSKQDATLAAVLLLGLFENITGRKSGIFAWGSHIEGAIQLVKSRGPDQLKTKCGLDLFMTVRTQMLMQRVINGTSPAKDVDWWASDELTTTYTSECQRLHIRAGEMRTQLNALLAQATRTEENIKLVAELAQKCQAIDQEFVKWSASLPSYYYWEVAAWVAHPPHDDYANAEAYPGRADAYRDILIASLWNMMRCSRILLSSVNVRAAAWIHWPVDYRTTPEYARASTTCVEAISDIIASVPCQLGWCPKGQDDPSGPKLTGFACGDSSAQKSLSGYFLTWPLTCILMQDFLSDSQRTWVHGRLKYIGAELGVQYASRMTKVNIRAPSMFIRQDGQMANHNVRFDRLLSMKAPS